jgi:hypothetical protein
MFKFTPKTIPNQIYLIGCGGTGSRLVPLLVQFIASITKNKSPRGWLDNPTIYIVDDDTVETKNLARQNFIAADVGKSKAAVLANRYGKAYGVNVVPIMKRVEGSYSSFIKDVPGNPTFMNSMVIFGVDTVKARRDILKTIAGDPQVQTRKDDMAGFSPFIIDAGNEDSFGQVRFFNFAVADDYEYQIINAYNLPAMSPIMTNLPAIPIDVKYYLNAVDLPGQGSCADLDQTLAINASMATEIMEIIQNYFYVRPMKFNMTSRSLDGDRLTIFNTARWLKSLTLTTKEDWQEAKQLLGSRMSVIQTGNYFANFVMETETAITAMNAPKVEAVAETAKKKSRSKKAVAEETIEAAVEAPAIPPLPEPVAARPVEEAAEAVSAVPFDPEDDIQF